jgi:hypothetical protein
VIMRSDLRPTGASSALSAIANNKHDMGDALDLSEQREAQREFEFGRPYSRTRLLFVA